jgi:type II secretory pathway component PulM
MRQTTQTTQTARQATAQHVQGTWTRERKIYLAIGVLASLAGVLLIAFSL